MTRVKIYKQSFAFILLLAMMGQTFTQGFYYVGYLMNRSAFEENCINKGKAWLHCNGKCQMMKKLVEHERKEQQQPEMKLAGKSWVLSSSSSYVISLLPPRIIFSHHYFHHTIGSPIDQSSSFFHPPAA